MTNAQYEARIAELERAVFEKDTQISHLICALKHQWRAWQEDRLAFGLTTTNPLGVAPISEVE